MHKALLFSILVASIVIPLRAARFTNRGVGLRRLNRQLVAMVALYVLALLFLYPLLKVK